MSTATIIVPYAPSPSSVVPPKPPAVTPRYHAMDCVRATAMLLGVFYHLPIAFMGGGGFMGFGGPPSPKQSIDNWLHSFRMAMFFLISGFFANMVLGKYGLGKYMVRRWWRIGAPLAIAIFAFGALRSFAPSVMSSAFGGFGPPPSQTAAPGGGFPFGPPGGAPGWNGAPPPGRQTSLPWVQGAPGANAPTFTPPFGPPPNQASPAAPPMPPFPFPAGSIPAIMQPPSHPVADAVFGKYAGNFNLEHLWFLWYLLIFVTIAPFIAKGIGAITARSQQQIDGFGSWMVRLDVLPFILALASLPVLVHARGFMGWSLMNPAGFMGTFPDFVWQYFPDLPFYFVYFMCGWWFFRLRSSLNDLARPWLWNLTIGVAAFAFSQWLSDRYSFQAAPAQNWIRIGGFALYGIGSAYSAFGLIGLFQRFLDRPSRLGRYFTDTMLWVYLVQLAIIPHVIGWVEPSRTSWWEASLAGMVLVTAIALVMFELFIRPTPLVHIFGPPTRRKPGSAVAPVA